MLVAVWESYTQSTDDLQKVNHEHSSSGVLKYTQYIGIGVLVDQANPSYSNTSLTTIVYIPPLSQLLGHQEEDLQRNVN